jgi:predicted transcriptional regulator of viral defense system
MNVPSYIKLNDRIDELQSKGVSHFTIEQVRDEWGMSLNSFRQQVRLLQAKSKVALIRNGFYVIVEPPYRKQGAPPASHYIDSLLQSLNRNYYLGLLNAAAWYGEAHQQPQSYNVIIQPPFLPDIKKSFVHVHFIYKNTWDEKFIIKQNIKTGFINVSSPALTAVDLCNYSKQVGGISAVATILYELANEIVAVELLSIVNSYNNLVAIQRLGYLLEFLGYEQLVEALKYFFKDKKYFPAKLESSNNNITKVTGNFWKIIVNEKVEIDQ